MKRHVAEHFHKTPALSRREIAQTIVAMQSLNGAPTTTCLEGRALFSGTEGPSGGRVYAAPPDAAVLDDKSQCVGLRAGLVEIAR